MGSMLEKIKEKIQNDYFLTLITVYLTAWVLFMIHMLNDFLFTGTGEVRQRLPEKDIGNTDKIIEQIIGELAIFLIISFPLVALYALVNIKRSLNRIEKRLPS